MRLQRGCPFDCRLIIKVLFVLEHEIGPTTDLPGCLITVQNVEHPLANRRDDAQEGQPIGRLEHGVRHQANQDSRDFAICPIDLGGSEILSGCE